MYKVEDIGTIKPFPISEKSRSRSHRFKVKDGRYRPDLRNNVFHPEGGCNMKFIA